jgi:polar amino acid transport system permease protein
MTPEPPLFDWRFAWTILPRLVEALGVTIEAVAVGTFIALLLGGAWAILRRSPRPWVRVPAHFAVELVRGTPLLIQLYILYFVLPAAGVTLSPFATGTIGLGLHYSCYVAEVFRAGIEGVPRGQWDAALALGLSPAHTWRAVILPQAIARVVPALGNYVIAMFKDTPLLAAITVAELLKTAKLIGATHFRYLEPLTMVGALFLVVSLAASGVARLVEQRHAVRHA